MSSLAHGKASSTSSALNAPQSESNGSRRSSGRNLSGWQSGAGVWRLVLCRHFGFPAYFGTSEMGFITLILNQLVDHQINTGTQCILQMSWELGQPARDPYQSYFLLFFLCHFLEITKSIPGLD